MKGLRRKGEGENGGVKIDAQKIKKLLTAKFIGSEIHIFDKVESTNDIAKDFAIKGYREGTVVIADSQSRGRGRLGRRWESPSGVGIYLSIILKPEKVMPQLTLVTGISVVEAIQHITCYEESLRSRSCAGLKWPNDIIINGKKVGGILTEGILKGSRVIVGIGVNVNTELSMFPDELRDRATSLLIGTGKRTDRNLLIAELLNRFEYRYKRFLEGDEVITEWKGFSNTVGRRISVNIGDKTLDGIAEMLDNDGSLMLRLDNGSLKKITAGEVCY
jgi:BirA family biotin operon repressor/biotin-[acetyl-CoA-carboxylase] ligase